jgi:hypothetical protein
MKFVDLKQRRGEVKFWYNYSDYLIFNYNSLLLGSLIFRGNKLLAFDFFSKLK